jgi:SsrA-binding protein
MFPRMAKKAAVAADGTMLIVKNRRALFDYHVDKRYEAGIELVGTEVKSLRGAQVNLSDAYASPDGPQLFLHNLNIAPYASASEALNHPPLRKRRLLLHRKELEELGRAFSEKGLTLVPLSLYFKDGRVKVELGVCRGKSHGDRRDTIVEREHKREMDRALRGGRKLR